MTFGFLKTKPLISEDMKDWIDESFAWFEDRYPTSKSLVLPTKEFFSANKGTPQETARAVLNDILRIVNFDLTVDLVELERVSEEYRHDYQSLGEVSGTYQKTENGCVIHYDPEYLKRPGLFISVMSHEVMHARLEGVQDDFPGGYEAHELATDLSAIISGFGLFQIQAADDLGWSGYLSQNSRAYALAKFLSKRGLAPDHAKSLLSPRCQKLIKKGFDQL